MRVPVPLVAWAVAWAAASAEAAPPAESPRPPANINARWLRISPNDAASSLERENREVFAARTAVVEALGLRGGQAVADIGAGSGFFVKMFAEEVGASGEVYAVDIAEALVGDLRQWAASTGTNQLKPVLSAPDDVRLAPASVDVVFTSDTYHHFENPPAVLASIRKALRPGGRLFVLDFERIPGTTPEWIMNHVRAGKKTVLGELTAGGFTFVKEHEVEGLKENYLVELAAPSPLSRTSPAAALLARSVAFHDPSGRWGQPLALTWESANPDGEVRMRFDLSWDAEGTFALKGRRKGHLLQGSIPTTGAAEYLVDGRPAREASSEVRTSLVLDREEGRFWRNYFGFLAALPMNLKGESLRVEPAVTSTRFAGRKARSIQVRFDEKGSDLWTLYFGPQGSLLGCRFDRADPDKVGERIEFEGLVEVGGLRLPARRRWYTNDDGKYLGEDRLLPLRQD
ncbi:MAG: methyltransferase domain-containing protein [Myxococcota bacterium]